MDNEARVCTKLEPFDITIRSNKLIKRPRQCSPTVAQSPSSRDITTLETKGQQGGLGFSLRIHCNQFAEHSIVDRSANINPCCFRIEENRISLECNQFINGVNVTPSTIGRDHILSNFDPKDHAVPKWHSFGVSSVRPMSCDDSVVLDNNKFWLCFENYDRVPLPGINFNKSILKGIILDYRWTTSAISSDTLHSHLSQCLKRNLHDLDPSLAIPSISSVPKDFSLEAIAMITGVDKILATLAQVHPLIFSPKRIHRFSRDMINNKRMAASVLEIYRNTSSCVTKESMLKSFQRLGNRFPNIPVNETRLLVEAALEAIAYRNTFARLTSKPMEIGPKAITKTRTRALSESMIENDAHEPSLPLQQQQEGQGQESTIDENSADSLPFEFFAASNIPEKQ